MGSAKTLKEVRKTLPSLASAGVRNFPPRLADPLLRPCALTTMCCACFCLLVGQGRLCGRGGGQDRRQSTGGPERSQQSHPGGCRVLYRSMTMARPSSPLTLRRAKARRATWMQDVVKNHSFFSTSSTAGSAPGACPSVSCAGTSSLARTTRSSTGADFQSSLVSTTGPSFAR